MEVTSKCCNQCLFSANKIVSDKRKESLIRDITSKQSYFICHKSSANGGEVCCRGFYEKLGQHSQMIRTAERLNCVKFVEVEQQ